MKNLADLADMCPTMHLLILGSGIRGQLRLEILRLIYFMFFFYISNNFSWIEVPKTPHKVVSFRANEFLEIASCSGVGKASQSVVVDLDEKVNTLTWQDQKLIEIDTGCHRVITPRGPNHIRLFLAQNFFSWWGKCAWEIEGTGVIKFYICTYIPNF